MQISPEYLSSNTFTLCLISLVYILPVWIFNFIAWNVVDIVFAGETNEAIRSYAKSRKNLPRKVKKIINKEKEFSKHWAQSPQRQISYISTIVCVYTAVFIKILFNLPPIIIYPATFIFSCILSISFGVKVLPFYKKVMSRSIPKMVKKLGEKKEVKENEGRET